MKRRKLSKNNKIDNFISWCERENLLFSEKVCIRDVGTSSGYGLVATEDIKTGDVLLTIPRKVLLTPDTCVISNQLRQEPLLKSSQSGWVSILLALMYEYTNDESRWRHYLSLVPDYTQLDLPMFWNKVEWKSLLSSTGVVDAVERDLNNIEKEFVEIVLPFVKKHPDLFRPECHDLEFYKKMVAFVMAYSFTEPEMDDSKDDDDDDVVAVSREPMMVPAADILNHIAANNAHLDFGKEFLYMVAIKDIKQGDEVFNTYGELPNWQLLQMYGFAEKYPSNHHDTLDISTDRIYTMLNDRLSSTEKQLFESKWTFLTSLGVVGQGKALVLGTSGILTEEEAYLLFKVLTLSETQFAEYKENEGWSDAEDESNENNSYSMSLDDIRKLPKSWREHLLWIANDFISSYGSTLEQEESLQQPGSWKNLTTRQRYSSFVRNGQLKLLHSLAAACDLSND